MVPSTSASGESPVMYMAHPFSRQISDIRRVLFAQAGHINQQRDHLVVACGAYDPPQGLFSRNFLRQLMPPMPPLHGGGFGAWFIIGILFWGAFLPVLSFLGVIATTHAFWRVGEDGLRMRPWMVVLFPTFAVLVPVGSMVVLSGSIPSGLGSESWFTEMIVTVQIPIGMGVVVGSGLYWRQWTYVGVGLGVILAGMVTLGNVSSSTSVGSLVLVSLLPVISIGVGYLSSGEGGAARERAQPASITGSNADPN